MPTPLKVFIAINVVAAIGLALIGVAAGGGFVSSVFPPDEGHEIKLVRIHQETAQESDTAAVPAQRAEIPPAYRQVDPTPSPWVTIPDGSVRFLRRD